MSDDQERPEGHDVVVSKGPCPKCSREKSCVTYLDGHRHCYGAGCDYYVPAGGETASAPRETFKQDYGELLDPSQQANPYAPLNKRGLTSDTMKRYGVFHGGYSGKPVQAYPYYDQGGELVAQKLRTPTKDFPLLKAEGYKSLSECQLFGHHVFGDRFDRQVIVTEGELDALSVAQATNFKVAVVSVGTGSQSAAKHMKANYLWLDRFTEIILWFDNDDAGKLAVADCAPLFKVGKVRIATASGFKLDGKEKCKDASDMLQANRPGDITAAVYAAQAWRPKGIVNAKESTSAILAPRERVHAYSYPPAMAKLQEMTGGMYPGEVVFHVAGTGVGKTAGMREIQNHLLEQNVKIAVFSFEDTKRDAMMGLMSVRAGERLQLRPVPDIADTKALEAYDRDMLRWHAEVFGSGLCEVFDPETAEWSLDALLTYTRYCTVALGCMVQVIDPFSFMAAGIDLAADERRVLDKVAAELSKQAKETGCHFQVAHHLRRTQGIPHEEGAPTSLNEVRSSGGLSNFASYVVGWERNNQAAGEAWRVTQSRIIKPSRRTGKSGLADVLYYGEDGRLVKSPLPFPPIGKPDGEAKSQPGGFSPVSSTDY
ncbi:bifunctional DNA primase/helicase [Aminobacter sp. HY435]|uniref:bifunctional DNA primase/helicase n=1 Tax=Aminobacter sp. HY435 TaxID=2970917 RepID=UPI0022B9C3C2|nr:bifunctional DNA primase/helicase [Aminobacter sp. HY435]